MRHCALGNIGRITPSDTQILLGEDFCEPDSCIFSYLAQFLHLLISRKALKSLTAISALYDQQQASAKRCTQLHISCFTITSNTDPLLFGVVSQSDLKCCLLGHSPHFAPYETTHNSHIVHFFVVDITNSLYFIRGVFSFGWGNDRSVIVCCNA